MTRISGRLMWVPVAVLSILLQVALTFADSKSTVTRTAIGFSKAYLFLDIGMSDYLCSDLSQGDSEGIVAGYLLRASNETLDLGYKPNAARRFLIHVKSEILTQGCKFAKVRITASDKTYLNPLFAWVGRLFHIGRTYHIDEVLELVKEGASWKVCGTPFDLCSGVLLF